MACTVSHCQDVAARKAIIPLLQQLYNHPHDTLSAYLEEMAADGYHLLQATNQAGDIVGAVGYRVGRRLYCGRYLHIDNLVIDVTARKQGVARAIIAFLKAEAARQQCDVLLADSYIDNLPAQTLFLRAGFTIRGFHLKHTL